MVDALRRDHVGVYGYPRPTTPFLDRLAAQGVVFDNAWAQAPQTFNSTSTLLTSRYFPYLAQRPGVAPIQNMPKERLKQQGAVPRLAEVNVTLPEVLHDAGYETLGLFNNPHHHPASGFWQGFSTAKYLSGPKEKKYAPGSTIVAAFTEILDGRAPDIPLFVYFHLMDVHNPYGPPQHLRDLFVTGVGRNLYSNGPPNHEPTAEDLAYMVALYDAEIRFVDEVIQSLVKDLENRGVWRNTVIIVTSDHGDEFLDHGGFGHGKTLEPELLRIPLIVAGPGAALEPGHRAGLVRNLDLAPTVAYLAGVEIPEEFEGENLAPALRGETLAAGRSSFAWHKTMRSRTDALWHFAVDLESGVYTLYDVRRDPSGTSNLAAERPEVVEFFDSAIRRFERQRLEAVQFMKDHPEGVKQGLPPDIAEQLKALGYL